MAKFNIVIATHGRFGEELVEISRDDHRKDGNVQVLSLLPTMFF